MSTAQQLAFSIAEERRGIHVLLWQDQGELARALLILDAALSDQRLEYFLLGTSADAELLRGEIAKRPAATEISGSQGETTFGVILIQQASAKAIGPWLNGWRRPLSEPPGSLLVIRHADFLAFQRAAPDLTSYVGARVHDAEQMLSIVSSEVASKLVLPLPDCIAGVLRQMPGAPYQEQELRRWISQITATS